MLARARILLPFAVLMGLLLLAPAVFTRVPFYTMSTAVQMAILATATLGLTLLTGSAGQISIGQAAFYGIGAFGSAILTTRSGLSPLVALLLGMVVAGVAAYVVGLFIFRVSGHYLALATLALGLVLGYVSKQLPITGGAEGIVDIPKIQVGSVVFGSDLSFYYLAAAVLFVALLVAWRVTHSTFGRSLTAIRDSEIAAAACGINIAARKRAVFVLAAVLAALAGSLYAHWVTFVDYHTLDLLLSLQLLIMATIGGLRTIWGAPVGAFIVITLTQSAKELLPKIAPNVGGQFEVAVYGIALIIVLLYLPTGVAGALGGLGRRRPAGDSL